MGLATLCDSHPSVTHEPSRGRSVHTSHYHSHTKSAHPHVQNTSHQPALHYSRFTGYHTPPKTLQLPLKSFVLLWCCYDLQALGLGRRYCPTMQPLLLFLLTGGKPPHVTGLHPAPLAFHLLPFGAFQRFVSPTQQSSTRTSDRRTQAANAHRIPPRSRSRASTHVSNTLSRDDSSVPGSHALRWVVNAAESGDIFRGSRRPPLSVHRCAATDAAELDRPAASAAVTVSRDSDPTAVAHDYLRDFLGMTVEVGGDR